MYLFGGFKFLWWRVGMKAFFFWWYSLKYLLSSYSVLGTVLVSGDIEWQIDFECACLYLNY